MEQNFHFDWSLIVKEAIKRRKEAKLTQEALSIIAGVSKPTLNTFEQGRTSVTVESSLKILRCLGLSSN